MSSSLTYTPFVENYCSMVRFSVACRRDEVGMYLSSIASLSGAKVDPAQNIPSSKVITVVTEAVTGAVTGAVTDSDTTKLAVGVGFGVLTTFVMVGLYDSPGGALVTGVGAGIVGVALSTSQPLGWYTLGVCMIGMGIWGCRRSNRNSANADSVVKPF